MDGGKDTPKGEMPRGTGSFLGGVIMLGVGSYLLLNQVVVTGSFWSFFGFNSFGLTMLPLLVGVGILFFNPRSVLGWLLSVVGAGIIVGSILMNMRIFFQPTSLFNTLVMLVLMAGGVGFIARGMKTAQAGERRQDS
jgi:hypothetical protein